MINDQYWFEFSKLLVENAQQSREKVAEKLQALVVWLWGIYTAATSVGFALSNKDISAEILILIISGSLSLILVYWATVWIQLPIQIEFDPRSPTEIAEAYEEGMKIKDKRLKFTFLLTAFSIILVSAGFVAASTINHVASDSYDLKAKIFDNNSKSYLALTAFVGKVDKVKITVIPINENGDKDLTNGKEFFFLPTDEGYVQVSLPLEIAPNNLLVEFEWVNGEGTYFTLSRKIGR
jgi:hypothetical protein